MRDQGGRAGPAYCALLPRAARGSIVWAALIAGFLGSPQSAFSLDLEFGNGGIADILADRLTALIDERPGFPIGAHAASDGPRLGADIATAHDTALFGARSCPQEAETKAYEIAAIRTRINLNRWGDHDPEGFMYANVDYVAAIQASAATGRNGNFGISLGLGDDLIQPLTLRVNVGDCLRVTLANLTQQPTSFHVHGADLVLAETGDAALSTNPNSTVLPGGATVYEWYVNPDHYAENTHYAHPHGPAARFQVSHGLFGAVIVEPEGAEYFDPRSGDALCGAPRDDGSRRCANSWDAMISPGVGADFREFAMFYHEIGHENFVAINAGGGFVPQFDPFSGTYKPSGRAINYRSEPFLRRLREADIQVPFYDDWHPDEALAYSSYSFGDPATPVPQSYLGDPVKFRLIHGGSETFHVPHLHGGGVQWQRQPHLGLGEADYVPLNAGLQKQFAASMPSSGNDSQTIGPSETYDLEVGCGSGGCQQSVGDFLFHCHIASHYIAGMWHFWRVYNTLQDGPGKTDDLAAVVELPDRQGAMERAVSSDRLIGETVAFAGREIAVDEAGLSELVEAQLPPRGVPRDVQDAQVFDWSREGNVYLNEPETEHVWPNFASPSPLARPRLMFAAATGHLAWPFLRPHLGERPPFAPHHGPAPYLEPFGRPGDAPADPGSNGATSLCPAAAPRRSFNIHAIQTPIDIGPGRTEPNGMLFVLQEHEAAARRDDAFKVPLAIRANQGDCVDVVLVNELTGVAIAGRELPDLLKTNLHIHFVQFDVQASDGVPTGAAFEQAPRPFTHPGQATPLAQAAAGGTTRIAVSDPGLFHIGAVVAVGIDQAQEIFETATVAAFEAGGLVLAEPLANDHRAGELVSAEFVRYRWYVARQNGAIYFHDHVDALTRWGRGLFGALIAEPRDATFHDPLTGAEITSGPLADIHTERQVVPGLEGGFREFVLFLTDRNPQVGSTVNMRADPLFNERGGVFGRRDRGGRARGASDLLLGSAEHGDPVTPLLQAYAGDPVMLRVLATATEEIHPLLITGHQFRQERFQPNSPLVNSVAVGVSERFNAYIASAGGAGRVPGDYLYYNGTQRHFQRGVWGLFRVHGSLTDGLQPLPGRTPPADPPTGTDPCPADAPMRRFSINVVSVPTTIDDGTGPRLINARRYVLESNDGTVGFLSGSAEPMILRANAGDCVEARVTNRATGIVGFAVEGASFDPSRSFGAAVGGGRGRGLGPGESDTYRYYLPGELGVLRIRDFASPFRNGQLGLYGALIVEPRWATYHDPVTNAALDRGTVAVIRLADGGYFREFVTLFAERDPEIGMFLMPYDVNVDGDAVVNYLATPFAPRIQRLGRRDPARLAHMFTETFAGPPVTPTFVAEAGEDVRFRVVSAYSEQPQVFSIEGHDWPLTPGLEGSDIVSSRLLHSGGTLNIELRSAGGPAGRPGDYLWLNHRLPFMEAGQWGLLRILPHSSDRAYGPRRDVPLYTQLRL